MVWSCVLREMLGLSCSRKVIPTLTYGAAIGWQLLTVQLVCCVVQVKILAADGAQTQIDMSFSSASLSALQMSATYSYYLKRSILQARELHSIPVVRQPPQRATSSQGQQLLSQPASLDALAQQVRPLTARNNSFDAVAATCKQHHSITALVQSNNMSLALMRLWRWSTDTMLSCFIGTAVNAALLARALHCRCSVPP